MSFKSTILGQGLFKSLQGGFFCQGHFRNES
jgi:hypothetical protein